MKKIIGILLVAVMLLSCSACFSASVVGTWEASVEMKEAVMAEVDSETRDEIAKYFDFDDLTLDMALEYKSDGTYEIEMELDELYDDLYEIIEDGLEDYLKAVLEEEGSGVSLDELLDYLGTDIEKLAKELMSEFDIEELAEDITTEGNWKIEGNIIYMSDGLDEEPDDAAEFELNGNTLKIIDEEITIVFKRVK